MAILKELFGTHLDLGDFGHLDCLHVEAGEETGGLVEKAITVHRDGKAFSEKRMVRSDGGAHSGAASKLQEDDKAEVTKGLDAKTYEGLPEEARPSQSTLDRAKDLAITVAAKALTWLHQFNESTIGKLVATGLDVVFDGPTDMKKLGYNPNMMSGTANPKVADAVNNAINEHLGFGMSGHLVASIAANVLSRVFVWAKRKVTGAATEDVDPDALELWSEFIAGLFAKLAKEYGTDGVPDAAAVLANLKELLK